MMNNYVYLVTPLSDYHRLDTTCQTPAPMTSKFHWCTRVYKKILSGLDSIGSTYLMLHWERNDDENSSTLDM